MILALAAGIMLTRFLVFLLFSERKALPAPVRYLGAALPHASMALLLVYCLRHVSPFRSPYGLPEALAVLITAGLHLWKNNVLVSIAGGTVFYMALVQFLFT
ncbi:MAG: AzlD domain-containing protein [Planctomycetes bacterium]|nr:AzlD domain-containing protein [Planctomycetota bacterium]